MFSSYAKLGVNHYQEVYGLDFEQFETGQIFRHHPGVTLSQVDNKYEAMDTQNWAHIHYDDHYASRTEFKKPLVVSTLTLQLLFGLSWKTYARKERITEYTSISMEQPVFDGDTLYAETEILKCEEKQGDCGLITCELRGLNQRHEIVVRVHFHVLIYKDGQHPYYGNPAFDYELTDEKFAAYENLPDGELKEQTGLYFEDLNIGETFEHAPQKFISAEEARSHALRSFDWNPRYMDANFSQDVFGDKTSPLTEAYIMGAITASTTRTLGRVVANLGWKNYRLTRHIYPEENLQTSTEIIGKRDSRSRPGQGIITVKSACFDKTGETIASYNRTFLVYKIGSVPKLRL